MIKLKRGFIALRSPTDVNDIKERPEESVTLSKKVRVFDPDVSVNIWADSLCGFTKKTLSASKLTIKGVRREFMFWNEVCNIMVLENTRHSCS